MTSSSDILSVSGARWQLREVDDRAVAAMAQRYGLPEIIARLLVNRGIALEDAGDFLAPTLRYHLPDPFRLRDMDTAAERITRAVMAGEQIAIFGDYDVDGATSSSLLYRYLCAVGALAPFVHIPDRMAEGYGPNAPALLSLQARGATLVITVDCGTVSFEPLAAAKAAGLEVIVIDHHIGEARMPDAVAIVNPNRFDESSDQKHLAAVGVSYLLVIAVQRCLREAGWFSSHAEPDILQWLDIVALGTVCDVVSLTGLNRALVTQGLKVLANRNNAGLRALADVGRLDEKPSAYHLGFILGPRINAGGRVGKSDLGVRLLTTEDEAEAMAIAQELDRLNSERKAIEATACEEALAQAEVLASKHAFLLVAGHWHQGVIGIIAGRVKERYGRPCAVIALDGALGKASARSVQGIDLGAAVAAAKAEGLLLSGGGHAMAAGFNITAEQIPALQAFLDVRLGDAIQHYGASRALQCDGRLRLGALTVEMAELLEKVAPFGMGNPTPRFMLEPVRIVKADIVGSDHVRCLLAEGGVGARSDQGRFVATGFRMAQTEAGKALLNAGGKLVRLAGQVKINRWQGRESAELHIDDVAWE